MKILKLISCPAIQYVLWQQKCSMNDGANCPMTWENYRECETYRTIIKSAIDVKREKLVDLLEEK
jgi:hypothetical protein